MLLIWLFSILAVFSPTHDFHTSVMNFSYKDDERHFEIDLNLDSEQFEYFLNQQSENSFSLDDELDEQTRAFIEDVINDNVKVYMNGSLKLLKLSLMEVTYAETILYFEPLCYKRKLKRFEMHNALMFYNFPNQKNLVKLNYKGEMKSFLFQQDHQADQVSF